MSLRATAEVDISRVVCGVGAEKLTYTMLGQRHNFKRWLANSKKWFANYYLLLDTDFHVPCH